MRPTLLPLCGLLSLVALAPSRAQTNWRFTHPSPAPQQLESLDVSGDTFLLGGEGGLLLASTDGLTWTRRQPGTRERFEHVAFRNGRWFAVGSSGALFSSPDTLSWEQRTNRAGAGPIAYGNGRWLALTGYNSAIVRTSTDGLTWTDVTVPNRGSETFTCVAFSGGRFWLGGNFGGLRTSPDGTTWTSITTTPSDFPGYSEIGSFVVSPNSLFIVRQRSSLVRAYTLANDTDWTTLAAPSPLHDLAYVNGRYLARSDLTVQSSPDAVTWTTLPNFPPEIRLGTIRVLNGVWLALDRNRRLQRSTDGEQWSEVGPRLPLTDSGVVFLNGHFLTSNGLRSVDGETWTADGFNPASLDPVGTVTGTRLSLANGRVFATQTRVINNVPSSEYWVSLDGVTGHRVAQIANGTRPYRIDYAAGHYLALVYEQGVNRFYTSTDGESWSVLPPETMPVDIFSLIGSDGDAFYGWAVGGDIYRSTDGSNWTLDLATNGRPSPELIAVAPGEILAPAAAGHYVRTPADGWQYFPTDTFLAPHYSGAHWCAFANLSTNYYAFPALVTATADGTWSAFPVPAPSLNYTSFASGNGRTVAIIDQIIAVADLDEDLVLHHGLPLHVDGVRGEAQTLRVEAESRSGATLHYQWTAGGVDIAGATQATYPINPPATGDAAPSFGVRITAGTAMINCETSFSVFDSATPVFLYSEGGIRPSYARFSSTLYRVTLDAPVRSPGLTTYRWERNGVVIPGATTSQLVYDLHPGETGDSYTLTATNDRGSATTEAFLDNGPQPTATPYDISVFYNPTAQSTYARIGLRTSDIESVQWRRNGVPIPGATGTIFHNVNLQPSESGYYDAVVRNAFATITTPRFFIPVTGASLTNLSVRAWTGHNDQAVVPGVVYSRLFGYPRPLVRAVGPTLADFGVTDPVLDPALTVIDRDGSNLAINDQWWDGNTSSGALFARLGAFSLGFDSLDAAVQVDGLKIESNTSLFTAPVSTAADDEGSVLVEVYRDTTADTERLINLSCRALVAPDKPMIAGFVIAGTGSIKLLIRAAGPALTPYNVTGALANPRLVLRDHDGLEIGNNDTWGLASNIDQIRASGALVGAFAFAEDSNDSALFVTLDPGLYTVEVQGVAGGSGIALVELYEVP